MLTKEPLSVEELITQMSLEEKLAQLGSYWIYELQTDGELDVEKASDKLKNGIGQITRVAGGSRLNPTNAARAANTLQKLLIERTRLGIPAILHEECCSGVMVSGGNAYPQMIGLASTFQPELAEAMTTAIRKQLRAIGATQALAPVLDIARDPRWGRIEETFGEDPTLASHFGVAYVHGLQGVDLSQGVMATGKHFVGHSLSQGGLNCAPVNIGLREVYDVYLPPFQAAIRDAGLASIMNAYPELDGEVVAASRHILIDILRGELGFDGLVVSDYQAVDMIYSYHRVAKDKQTAARLALEAGIDVELPSTDCYGEALKAALEAGDLSTDLIDQAVRRHLQAKVNLGLFDNPYVDEGRVLEVFEALENRALARKIARQSMVLLKNDGILPLKKTIGSLAVIGPNADQGRAQLGDYSYPATVELLELQKPVHSAFVEKGAAVDSLSEMGIITILDGIRAAASSDTHITYAQGCSNLDADSAGFDEAIAAAKEAEVVVLVLGDLSGLTPQCTTGETRDSADLRLPGVQEDLAKAICETGTPVVAVLVNGRPYAASWLEKNANAILEAWLPGEEGGGAVADILFGSHNPGGKLPVTIPRSVGQVPVYYNHKPSGMRSNWYVNYVSEKVAPLYPFGHGLSYTTFEYGDLSIQPAQAASGECVRISFTLTNSGAVEGEEVVQLYLRDQFASLPRPVKELKGYARVPLKPGESRLVTFHLPVNQMAFYDRDLQLIVEAGEVQVMVGSSSEDIRLEGSFEITGAVKTPIQERVFNCPVEIQ